MKNAKRQVIQFLESMPNDVTLDDILAALYFKRNVEIGLRQLDEGKGIPHATVKARMAKYLK